LRKSGKKLRKSGKNSNIKIAEIWEKVDIKTAEIWENNAEIWQLIAEFWQLIDFSQFAEIWENVAELWCFPQKYDNMTKNSSQSQCSAELTAVTILMQLLKKYTSVYIH
jgi:hypothetical protein